MTIISKTSIKAFEESLYRDEKSTATVQKYLRAVEQFADYLQNREVTKQLLIAYREALQQRLKARTVNGKLTAINAYLNFSGQQDCKVKLLKIQRQVFADESRELSLEEYKRLVMAAKSGNNERLYLLLQTVCATGIRIGELRFITVETARSGRAEINLKGKNRTIILQMELRNRLLTYCKENGIKSGLIFRTKSGKPLDRSNICHCMKKLCQTANVDKSKVFPHNLRHLFARTFYEVENNLAHLADVLGHSSIETTRIYVAVSASEHEKALQKMNLII